MLKKIVLSLGASLAILAPSFSLAAALTGTVTRSPHFAEALDSTDLHYAGGLAYSDLPVLLICLDVRTGLPPDGPTGFLTRAGASAIKGGSGAAGIAAVHWLIDQYYLTYFKNGNSRQQWAFQYAVWEIGNDYDGTAGSISTSVGASRPVVDGYFGSNADFINAYQAMYAAMVAALPTLPASYRSQTYTLDLFNNQDPTFQSMVALVERAPAPVAPTPIPTLGQWGLLALSGLFAVLAFPGLRRSRVA